MPNTPYSVPYFFRDRGGWNPLTTYTLFPIFLPYAISSVGSLSTVQSLKICESARRDHIPGPFHSLPRAGNYRFRARSISEQGDRPKSIEAIGVFFSSLGSNILRIRHIHLSGLGALGILDILFPPFLLLPHPRSIIPFFQSTPIWCVPGGCALVLVSALPFFPLPISSSLPPLLGHQLPYIA